MAKDPVCAMEVGEKTAIRLSYAGSEYFFCSINCKDKFIQQKGIKDAAVCYPPTKNIFLKNKLFILLLI